MPKPQESSEISGLILVGLFQRGSAIPLGVGSLSRPPIRFAHTKPMLYLSRGMNTDTMPNRIASKGLTWGLLLVPVLVAALQLGLSHFSSLNRWKGGGFGMYATPHPRDQTIWLQYDSAAGPVLVPVSPVSPSATGRELFALLETDVPQLLVFPTTLHWNTPLRQRLNQWKTRYAHRRSCALVTSERNWNLKEKTYVNKTVYRFDF
jgi:hypothetical protein